MLSLFRSSRKFLRPLAVLVGAVFLTLTAVVSGSAVTHASTLTVVNTSDSGPGSLRQAVANAASGDTINFDPSLSGQTITLTSGDIGIGGNLTITGPAGGVTVSGNNTSRVFTINSGVTVNMSHLTISNGSVTTGGGGIYNVGTLSLTNLTVSGNTANIGGGIFNGGTVTLMNSTVSGNSAHDDGGGIYNQTGGTLNVESSAVSLNSANGTCCPTTGGFGHNGGGGIYNVGSATVVTSTVSGNSATVGGGGILNKSTLSGTNSTVAGNNAGDYGGGIMNFVGGTLNLTNSSISGNGTDAYAGGINNALGTVILTNTTVSGNRGSGIWNDLGSATLTNSTVSDNSLGGIVNGPFGTLTLTNDTVSGNSGGGIYNGAFNAGGLTLTNTIVAEQTSGGDCATNAPITSNGYNLDSDGSCGLTATGDLPNTNPILAPLALNAPGSTETQALLAGSPAIDHIPVGVNGCGTTITTDQRGVARPQGNGCDIGAYEFLNTPATVSAHAFKDVNKNGAQDAGEPNLAGWTMSLYQGSGCAGSALTSLTTDGDGNVAFGGLAAGDYSVAEALLPKWAGISPVCQDVTVGPGDSAQLNFGNVPQHKYVVFVGGIAGSLSSKDIAKLTGAERDCSIPSNDPVFGNIKSVLVGKGYACSDFLQYSYKGGQMFGGKWRPKPYSCSDTGNWLDPAMPGSSTQLLHTMLTEFYAVHRDAVFVLVGHSQGGLISFMELEGLRFNGMSPSVPIDGVVTLDSPIGGVPPATFDLGVRILARALAVSSCGLKDMNIYLNSNAASEIKARSILGESFFSGTVSWAQGRGTSVTTLGNWDDCFYSPEHCGFANDWSGETFPSTALTQIVTNADLYGVQHGAGKMYDLCSLASPIGCVKDSHTGILREKATAIAGFIGQQY